MGIGDDTRKRGKMNKEAIQEYIFDNFDEIMLSYCIKNNIDIEPADGQTELISETEDFYKFCENEAIDANAEKNDIIFDSFKESKLGNIRRGKKGA